MAKNYVKIENAAGHEVALTSLATADRSVSWPDKDGTVAFLDDVGGGGATYYGQTVTANAYTVALTPTLGALATGVVIKVKFKDASTAASTLNADGLGAKKLYKNPTTQIGNGDITDEQIYDMTYDAALDGAAGGWLIDGYAGGGGTVPDADATTKGIVKLYPSTSLGSNTDGSPTQNAVKVYVDAAVGGGTSVGNLLYMYNNFS